MKSIKYVCARLFNGLILGALLLSSVTAVTPLLSATASAQVAPLEVLAPDTPSLTAPVSGSTYRSEFLPVDQTWTGMPLATSYTYESYTSNPELGPATIVETDETPKNDRPILKTTAEGTYWWRVKANNVAGSSEWSQAWQFTIDNTAPTIDHDLKPLVGRTVTIAHEILDATPKEGSLTITKLNTGAKYYSGVKVINEYNQIQYQLDTQAMLFGDGQYQASFFSRDKAGNESTTNVDFTLDTTAPTITYGELADANSGDVITISGTVSEPDVDVVYVTIDSIGYPATVDEFGNWSISIDTSDLGGEYDVLITALDRAGNLGEARTTLNVGFVLGEDIEGTDNGLTPLPPLVAPPLLIAGLPIITTPSETQVNEPDPEDATAEEDDPPGDVEGVSSLSTFAQAADTDATDGSFWGVDWYWWLLIVGGGAAAVGWLITLVRRGGTGQ